MKGLSIYLNIPDSIANPDGTSIPDSFRKSVNAHPGLEEIRTYGQSNSVGFLRFPPPTPFWTLPDSQQETHRLKLRKLYLCHQINYQGDSIDAYYDFLRKQASTLEELFALYISLPPDIINCLRNIKRYSAHVLSPGDFPSKEKLEYLQVGDFRWAHVKDQVDTRSWIYGNLLPNLNELYLTIDNHHQLKLPTWKMLLYVLTAFSKLEHLTLGFPLLKFVIEDTYVLSLGSVKKDMTYLQTAITKALQLSQDSTSLRSLTVIRWNVLPESIKGVTLLDKAKPIFRASPLLRSLTIRYAEGEKGWWSQIGRYERIDGLREEGRRIAAHEVLRPKRDTHWVNHDKKSSISHFTFVLPR